MIQRKQTLWLLMAAVCVALSLKFPVYAVAEKGTQTFKNITAMEADYTIASAILVAGLCLVTVFFYNRLKLQLRLALLSVLGCALHLVLLYVSAAAAGHGNPALTALLPLAAVFFALWAVVGVRKDKRTLEELNSNRLR